MVVLLFSYSTISFFIFNLNVFFFFFVFCSAEYLSSLASSFFLYIFFIIPLLLLAHKYKTKHHNIANRRDTQLHKTIILSHTLFGFCINSYIFHSFINIYIHFYASLQLWQSQPITAENTSVDTSWCGSPNRDLLWTVVTVKLTFSI